MDFNAGGDLGDIPSGCTTQRTLRHLAGVGVKTRKGDQKRPGDRTQGPDGPTRNSIRGAAGTLSTKARARHPEIASADRAGVLSTKEKKDGGEMSGHRAKRGGGGVSGHRATRPQSHEATEPRGHRAMRPRSLKKRPQSPEKRPKSPTRARSTSDINSSRQAQLCHKARALSSEDLRKNNPQKAKGRGLEVQKDWKSKRSLPRRPTATRKRSRT